MLKLQHLKAAIIAEYNTCHLPKGKGGGKFCSKRPAVAIIVPKVEYKLSMPSNPKAYTKKGKMKVSVVKDRRLIVSALKNIDKLMSKATDKDKKAGKQWYQDAHVAAKFLASRHGVSLEKTVGVIAALSPRCSWEDNIRGADRLMAQAAKGVSASSIQGITGVRANIAMAHSIFKGADPVTTLSGIKRINFYMNVGYPDKPYGVTVDGITYSALRGLRMRGTAGEKKAARKSFSDHRYSVMGYAISQASKKYGVMPHQLQAMLWITYKRLEGVAWRPQTYKHIFGEEYVRFLVLMEMELRGF